MMLLNYDNYNALADKIRQHSLLCKLIHCFNKIFTGLGFVMYPLLLLWLLSQGFRRDLFFVILIPGISFVAVSFLRKRYNARRPYEVYPINPLIIRDKSGASFPSRHTFSIMLIGGLWFIYQPAVGIVILVCGAGLAVIRVIGGVHFPRDVIGGTVLGLICAFLVYVFVG